MDLVQRVNNQHRRSSDGTRGRGQHVATILQLFANSFGDLHVHLEAARTRLVLPERADMMPGGEPGGGHCLLRSHPEIGVLEDKLQGLCSARMLYKPLYQPRSPRKSVRTEFSRSTGELHGFNSLCLLVLPQSTVRSLTVLPPSSVASSPSSCSVETTYVRVGARWSRLSKIRLQYIAPQTLQSIATTIDVGSTSDFHFEREMLTCWCPVGV